MHQPYQPTKAARTEAFHTPAKDAAPRPEAGVAVILNEFAEEVPE